MFSRSRSVDADIINDPAEIRRIIFDQATRNYEKYVTRCRQRAVDAIDEAKRAADELDRMLLNGRFW